METSARMTGEDQRAFMPVRTKLDISASSAEFSCLCEWDSGYIQA